MHVPLRRIDVGDETIDDFVVRGQHLDRVAAENRHVAERFGEAHGRRELRTGLGVVDRRAPRKSPVNRLGVRNEVLGALAAQCGQARSTDQQVKGEPDRGFEEDQQQPAFRCVGRAAKRHDDEHADADRPFGGDERLEPDVAIGQKVEGQRFFRPPSAAGVTAASW